jgi:hypothetical protein
MYVVKDLVRMVAYRDTLEHILGGSAFFASPVCILVCLCKLLFWQNLLPHTSHLYGLSPVCVLICICKLLFWLNSLPHTSELTDTY